MCLVKYSTLLKKMYLRNNCILFYFEDLDPCLHVTCLFYGLCKAFGPHDARCVCLDLCPSLLEPVCSSNGTTYGNECSFKRETCLLRRNFTVQHPGRCEGRGFQRFSSFIGLKMFEIYMWSICYDGRATKHGHLTKTLTDWLFWLGLAWSSLVWPTD